MESDVPAQHPYWIPLTKVIPPRVSDDILPRPQLLNQLASAVTQKRLTLISAPAGSGKTVAAASLTQVATELPMAWLSLDEEDDDPATFMWLMTAALQKSFSGCGANALTLLSELQNPAAELKRVISVLINDVLVSNLPTFAFVVDDYHLIQNPAIHEALTYLLERLPASWRVVLTTRRDPPLPLARLRSRGQLATFGLPDLLFQSEDVQSLFSERLSLSLSADAIETLQTRTEGWIAGLRLVASTLQAIESAEHRQEFIERIAVSDQHVFDLLAEEVLYRQPTELQAFLLETSILRELSPALCQAVTGLENAPSMLLEVVQRNLFLSVVGEFETAIRPTYRYHDLFAEFLRHRLVLEQPGRIKELHHRAANAETTPARVVGHYLAAEAWEQMALAIEKYGPEMLTEGHTLRLRGWILALPEYVRKQHPWINYLLGMCFGEVGDLVTAQPYLQTALKQFSDVENQGGVTAALVALAYHAIGRHDFEQGSDLLEQVLARPLSPYESVRAHISHAWLMLYRNNWAQVDTDTARAMRIALASEDPGAINVLARQLTTPLILGQQGIDPIERYHQTVLADLSESVSVVRAGTLAVLSNLQMLRGSLEQAVANARQARAISQQLGGLVWMDMGWDLVLLADALVHADYATFERRWRARLPVYEGTAARQWLILYFYFQGRALWMQQRWDDLAELTMRAGATEIDFEPPESVIARQMLAALALLHSGQYKRAESILLEAITAQQQARQVRGFFDVRFLLAHLYQEQHRPEDALTILKPLLTTLSQQDAPGFVLQEGQYVIPLLRLAVEHDVQPSFAEQTLRMFDLEIRPLPIPGTAESLTPREVEVLRLLMTGATNKEIAEQLVITPRTAKAHVSNILGKLKVSSRTEAVARAHELSLLNG